eukprot:gene46260-62660_t
MASICEFIRNIPRPEITEHCAHPWKNDSKPLEETFLYLQSEYNQQMFYGITYLNNMELKTEMEKLSSTMRRAINEGVEVPCPYCFVLTSQKLGPSSEQLSSESREQSSSESSSFLQYLKSVVSTQWQSFSTSLLPKKTSDEHPQEPSELWFYLLDQYTMKPIILAADDPNSNRYPIRVS